MNNKLLYTAGYVVVLVLARVAEALAEQALDSALHSKANRTNTRKG